VFPHPHSPSCMMVTPSMQTLRPLPQSTPLCASTDGAPCLLVPLVCGKRTIWSDGAQPPTPSKDFHHLPKCTGNRTLLLLFSLIFSTFPFFSGGPLLPFVSPIGKSRHPPSYLPSTSPCSVLFAIITPPPSHSLRRVRYLFDSRCFHSQTPAFLQMTSLWLYCMYDFPSLPSPSFFP